MTSKPKTEGRPKIAYQGEPGANSHMACVEAFPEMEPLACATFDDAFAAVAGRAIAPGQHVRREERAELAMIPIENSANGRVADVHHLMPLASLHIVGEHFMPIHHQLMAAPGASLKTVKSVQSHVQALGQCRIMIRERGLKAVIGEDTAGSAAEIARAADPTRAAIASKLAAKIYRLDILQADVEDAANNTTRFVVLSRDSAWAKRGKAPVVTSFVFRVRNLPAALYKALGGFATNGVNMNKLESYQLDGKFTATQFYADVEGHPEDPPLARALEELAFFCEEFRIVGVYPAHPFRAEASEG